MCHVAPDEDEKAEVATRAESRTPENRRGVGERADWANIEGGWRRRLRDREGGRLASRSQVVGDQDVGLADAPQGGRRAEVRSPRERRDREGSDSARIIFLINIYKIITNNISQWSNININY